MKKIKQVNIVLGSYVTLPQKTTPIQQRHKIHNVQSMVFVIFNYINVKIKNEQNN